MVELGRPQMTLWRMRIACCIPKATNTHSDYVVLIAFVLLLLHVEPVTVKKYNFAFYYFMRNVKFRSQTYAYKKKTPWP